MLTHQKPGGHKHQNKLQGLKGSQGGFTHRELWTGEWTVVSLEAIQPDNKGIAQVPQDEKEWRNSGLKVSPIKSPNSLLSFHTSAHFKMWKRYLDT